MDIIIRQASHEDREAIWKIIRQVIDKGDSYVFSPASSRSKMLAYWFHHTHSVFVAVVEEKVAGTFFIREQIPDLGSHVANASFKVDPDQSAKGIGKKMGAWALKEATRLGFRAMQFNMVVATNEPAVNLWKSLGFKILAEIPEAFRHKEKGLVNTYIMYRTLS